MLRISVIVPLYKGDRYVNGIVKCIEANQKNFGYGEVELIFVNDNPLETIELKMDSFISVYVFNTSINQGIQGARIRGCKMARGQYVLMLDQDDIIADDCLAKQYENIVSLKADVSVCRALENGKKIYNELNKFENIGDRKYMLSHINPIISPGQALIKKDAIPKIWMNHILPHNGADDWLLWLGMLSERRLFVRNDRILYEHRVDGNNTSWNGANMLLSEREVLHAIEKVGAFRGSDLEMITDLISNDEFRHIQSLEKYREMFMVFDSWMSLETKNETIAEYIYSLGYKEVAVYGYGYIGRQLVKKIKSSPLTLIGVIDINADYIDADVNICVLEKFNKEVELIISTTNLPQQVVDLLAKKTKVLSIQELLKKWEISKDKLNGEI